MDGPMEEGQPSLVAKVGDGFRSLRGSPPELWKAYAINFLESYAYFSFSLIFTLFLSKDFGYNDIQAGTIYGGWGALITVFGVATGVVIDNLGVSKSMRAGFSILLVSRCLVFAASSRVLLLINIFFLLPLGACLAAPVLAIGLRRYTCEKRNRGFAFGLFYVVMNVAALFSGPAVDICTSFVPGKDGGAAAEEGEWIFSGYRAVILTGIVANVCSCIISFTVREIKLDVDADGDENDAGGVVRSAELDAKEDDEHGSVVASFEPKKGSPKDVLMETLRSRTFWRFFFVCFLMINVRMIFRHLDATLPKYMIREFGQDAPYGTIYAINPAIIILIVPLVTAATTKVPPLVMIHWGSYVSALSVFVLVFTTSIWGCALFVTILSFGEAIWSPRLFDYSMSVAEEGREGTYMALTNAPLFLAKLPVGFLSGILLHNFCPEEGERHSSLMWLIVGLITIPSPIMMTLFWRCINRTDEVHGSDTDGTSTISNNVEIRDSIQDPGLGSCLTTSGASSSELVPDKRDLSEPLLNGEGPDAMEPDERTLNEAVGFGL